MVSHSTTLPNRIALPWTDTRRAVQSADKDPTVYLFNENVYEWLLASREGLCSMELVD
jgi:hypothetical protein